MDVDGDNDMVIKKPYVNVKKDYDWGIAKEPSYKRA